MLKWAFRSSIDDQEPQFPNLERESLLPHFGRVQGSSCWMPVGSQEGSQDGWVALSTLPPCHLGFQDRGVLLILVPIFGHFSCHWLLINAQPPTTQPSAADRCVGPVETRGGQSRVGSQCHCSTPLTFPPNRVSLGGYAEGSKGGVRRTGRDQSQVRRLGSSGWVAYL